MKSRIAALMLTVGLALPAAGPAAPVFSAAPHVTQKTLANGLRVVVVENHSFPVAQVSMWYRFGSADDPPGRTGLAHGLEHMMFRGTHALPGSSRDYVNARFGIDANAETDYESTHYYQTVPVDSVATALHIEADRMHGLLLSPRDWNLERGPILAELASDEASDEDALETAVRAAAYGTSPFARDPGGTARDVQRTGAADLRRAYDAAYQPDNATLVVTGDVDPASIARLAAQIFGPIRGHAHVRHPRTERIAARGFTVRRTSSGDAVVDVALESQGMLANGGAAEEVAEELLQPEHAALRVPLVDAGPCSSYDIDDDYQLYGGLIHILCRIDDEVKPADAVRTIRGALRRLAAHLPAGAIENARFSDLASSVYLRDSLNSEDSYYGQALALQRIDPRLFDAEAARVSAAAVAAVLRRWATPVGVGISANVSSPAMYHAGSARRSRTEHVLPAARSDAFALPAWAAVPVPPFRTPAAIEAFALPNGLRLFVAPRRGNGSAYVRGGFEVTTAVLPSRVWPRARLERVEEAHAMKIELERQAKMRGLAGDLPLMLAILADTWRAQHSVGGRRYERYRPRPEHAWLAVTGDVDPDKVLATVTRLYGGWHVAAGPDETPRPRAHRRVYPSGITVFDSSGAEAKAYTLRRVPGRDDPDFDAMTLLNEILGEDGDADTRLASEVRTRRGLAYMIGSYYDADDGLLYTGFNSTRRNFRAARAAVEDVVHTLRLGTISSAELARARHKLLAKGLLAQASPNGILDVMATAANGRRAPNDVDSLAARYGAVSLDDVRRVARTRISKEPVFELDQGRAP